MKHPIESSLKAQYRGESGKKSRFDEFHFFGYHQLVTKLGLDLKTAILLTKIDRYLLLHAERRENFAYHRIWTRLGQTRLHKEIPILSQAAISRILNWLQEPHQIKRTSHEPFELPPVLMCATNGDHKQAYWWAFTDYFIELTKSICMYSDAHISTILPENARGAGSFKNIDLKLKPIHIADRFQNLFTLLIGQPIHIADRKPIHIADRKPIHIADSKHVNTLVLTYRGATSESLKRADSDAPFSNKDDPPPGLPAAAAYTALIEDYDARITKKIEAST